MLFAPRRAVQFASEAMSFLSLFTLAASAFDLIHATLSLSSRRCTHRPRSRNAAASAKLPQPVLGARAALLGHRGRYVL